MKKIKLHINVALLLLWSFFSYAQQYTNYNTKNGLPSNHVYRITQDKQGFIWMITDKGIVKFNGENFKTFTTKEGLPTNDIWDFRITKDNKFWFFSKANSLGYIANDSVYSFQSEMENKNLYPNTINSTSDSITFQDRRNVYSLLNKKWKITSIKKHGKLHDAIIHSIVKYIFFSDNTDSVYIENKNHRIIKSLKTPQPLLTQTHRTQINDSLFCWISNKGYTLFNFNTLKFTSKSFKNQIQRNTVRFTRVNIVTNEIQFSGEHFVAKLDSNYNLINIIHIPKNINSHFSFIDKNKNLWIATLNKGVYFLSDAKQKATIQLNNQKIGKIRLINNKIIANIYNKGFYKYDIQTKKFVPYLKDNGFIYSANYLEETQTEYYLTDSKIILLKNNETKFLKAQHNKYYTNILNDLARKIVSYKGFLFSFGSSGLFQLKPNLEILNEYEQNGIRDLLVFNKELIIATSSGLLKFNNGNLTPIANPKISNKPILSLSKIKDAKFVVCTDGFGAYITDLKKTSILEKSDFLDVQDVYIHNNEIYLATNQGVWNYLKIKNTYKLQKKYTINNGLNTNKTRSVYVKDSTLFASSNEGINILSTKNKLTNQFLNIYFNNIAYNKKNILKNSKVNYTTNNQLEIKIATIDFSENKKRKYQYQLKPIHKKWTETNSNQLLFNDLPPNSYTLKIKKLDKTTSFNFIITPLWYQTIWFKVLSRITFLLLFIGTILYFKQKKYTKEARKLKAQKKLADFELHALRSQMNPHFVFNSLNAIQYYITKNEIELSEKYLVKFSRLIRMFFDFSREEEIRLKEEINLLKGYLEIEKMRFGDEFNYVFKRDLKLNIQDTKIPTMILQPFVENAVNHGIFHNQGKGMIQLYFKYISNDTYAVSISDDGVGMEKSKIIQQNSIQFKQKKNHSTNIIKDRIALLNQAKKWTITYSVLNKKKGTTINLTFKKND